MLIAPGATFIDPPGVTSETGTPSLVKQLLMLSNPKILPKHSPCQCQGNAASILLLVVFAPIGKLALAVVTIPVETVVPFE